MNSPRPPKASETVNICSRAPFTPGDFACIGDINISLGSDCEYEVLASDVLVGGPYGCVDNYEVEIGEGTPEKYVPIPTSPVISKNELGKKLIYMVRDPLSGLNCWGYITIEDKLGPIITGNNYFKNFSYSGYGLP